MSTRILIIDDDERLNKLLTQYLSPFGFTVQAVTHPDAGLRALKADPPDLVVLDIMLPDTDGLTVCRKVRETSRIPIIMLTARGEEADRVSGLELGADDYVTKPFSPKELSARVTALLRRSTRTNSSSAPLHYGPITIDADRHTVVLHGEEVRLTAKEFLLLHYLVQHKGRVLSRDLLLSDVWGYNYTGGTRTVDVHIRRLREKLPPLLDAIETIKQFGYKLVDRP
jgi:two-component system, OmpR family, alkaline phosphatase synthesis response regulator PhoP